MSTFEIGTRVRFPHWRTRELETGTIVNTSTKLIGDGTVYATILTDAGPWHATARMDELELTDELETSNPGMLW